MLGGFRFHNSSTKRPILETQELYQIELYASLKPGKSNRPKERAEKFMGNGDYKYSYRGF